jgi:hypothetical protein
MYVINIMVMMMMMFVGLRSMIIESWLNYEIWDIRSVNRLYIDNLRPPDIGETAKILVEILVDFYMKIV